MHEVFLCRLAAHPVFRNDHFFQTFLQYEQDVCLNLLSFNFINFLQLLVRGKSKKEMIESIFKRFTISADEVLLAGQVID